MADSLQHCSMQNLIIVSCHASMALSRTSFTHSVPLLYALSEFEESSHELRQSKFVLSFLACRFFVSLSLVSLLLPGTSPLWLTHLDAPPLGESFVVLCPLYSPFNVAHRTLHDLTIVPSETLLLHRFLSFGILEYVILDCNKLVIQHLDIGFVEDLANSNASRARSSTTSSSSG